MLYVGESGEGRGGGAGHRETQKTTTIEYTKIQCEICSQRMRYSGRD